MLYSRAADNSPDQPLIHAEAFSPNTPEGACPRYHGHDRVCTVTGTSKLRDHRTDFTM